MTGTRTRRLLAAVACALLAATCAACTTTVTGSGRALATAPAAASVTDADGLADLLIDVPAGTTTETGPWADNETPTVGQLAIRLYRDPVEGIATLQDYGITHVAHRWFSQPDGTGADVMLVLFADRSQPFDWMSQETATLRFAGLVRSTLDGVPAVDGYSFPLTDDGFRDTRYFALKGRIGLLAAYFTKGELDTSEAEEWLGAQYANIAG